MNLPRPTAVAALALAHALAGLAAAAIAGEPPLRAEVEPHLAALVEVYRDLHQHPELAFEEKRTAALLARALRELGFEVTEGVGKTGLVGVLRNGEGPTVMLRTELDALPLLEKTGLPFASRATSAQAGGSAVPVAHACGHDLHMTGWLGAARVLAQTRERWRGTLLFVGQPAEETVSGARAMLDDGLLTRFPRPSFALSMHDDATLPAGVVGYHAGAFRAGSDEVDITLFGRGGHGARPHAATDPVVMAARTVLGLQTVVSRENDPLSPAVITVGTLHAGTKVNIIPDQAALGLTVRYFTPQTRTRLLAGIERQARGEAIAAGAPQPPEIVDHEQVAPVVNDAALIERVARALERALGPERVVEMPALMTSEDFAEFQRAGLPAVLLHVGAARPAALAAAKAEGRFLEGPHSPTWAPDVEGALPWLAAAEVAALRAFLGAAAPPQ